MSTIASVLSSAKPVNPNPGSLFYFTDTNQIAIYQGGGVYYVYNKDTSAYSSGGEENLNYANGIFNDSNASYYISTAPSAHIDIDYWNGSEKTDWLHEDGTPVTSYSIYHGSTNNGQLYEYEQGKLINANIEGIHTRHLGGGGNIYITQPHPGRTSLTKGRGFRATYGSYYTGASGFGNTGSGDFTYMFVNNSDQGTACALCGAANSTTLFYINAQYTASVILKGMVMGGYNTWNTKAGSSGDLSSVELGVPENGLNSIFVVRRKDGVIKVWGSAIPESTAIGPNDRRTPFLEIPSGNSLSTKSFDYTRASNVTGGGTNNSQTYIPEILVFSSALEESDLDKAYLYLLNKYTNAEGGLRAMQAVRNDGTVGSVDISDPTSFNLLQV